MFKKILYFSALLISLNNMNSNASDKTPLGDNELYQKVAQVKQESNAVPNEELLNLLEQVKIRGDQNNTQAQLKYVSIACNLNWDMDSLKKNNSVVSTVERPELVQIQDWQKLEIFRKPVLNTVVQFRDNLVKHYETDISGLKDETEIRQKKLLMAKLLLISNPDDSSGNVGNQRIRKFLETKRSLQDTPEGKELNEYYENFKIEKKHHI